MPTESKTTVAVTQETHTKLKALANVTDGLPLGAVVGVLAEHVTQAGFTEIMLARWQQRFKDSRATAGEGSPKAPGVTRAGAAPTAADASPKAPGVTRAGAAPTAADASPKAPGVTRAGAAPTAADASPKVPANTGTPAVDRRG